MNALPHISVLHCELLEPILVDLFCILAVFLLLYHDNHSLFNCHCNFHSFNVSSTKRMVRYRMLPNSCHSLGQLFFLRPFARVIVQLTYDLFSLSCNLSPEDRRRMVELGTTGGKQFIIAMHPHGVISYQAPIWCAYCHQYLTFGDKCTHSE